MRIVAGIGIGSQSSGYIVHIVPITGFGIVHFHHGANQLLKHLQTVSVVSPDWLWDRFKTAGSDMRGSAFTQPWRS